ncbi:citryl-CoA lyase [bacterium]|nr:citryl-CoA lyase [bacterium]
MMIGKRGEATTSICMPDATSITVRDRDLASDLMGRLTFTEYFFLLTTGREPTPDQRFFLDLLLVSIAEHGLVPTNQVARMTLASDPKCLQGAVAAGILGCGSVVLGTAEDCGTYLQQAIVISSNSDDRPTALREFVQSFRDAGSKIPGFGHPMHKPVDPRAERILQLADEHGVSGAYVDLARQTRDLVHQVWAKPLTMNVSMMIAAVLLDLDFPASVLKGVPLLARTASLIAHLAEEAETPIGFVLAHHAEESIAYRGRSE